MSKIFLVNWSIEVDADTPEQAAREALDIMRDYESTATCFKVDDKDGNVKHIDLIQSESHDGIIVGPSINDLIESGHLAPMQVLRTSRNDIIPEPTYSPECFDGRFFKWDGYVLDTISECEDNNIMVLTIDGKFLGDFHIDPQGYEDDQEGYLNYALNTVKDWIVEQNLFPAILKKQQS